MGSHCQIRQKVTITAAPAAGLGGGGQVAGDCQQGTELVCVMFYGQDANMGFSCPEADGFTLRDSVQPQGADASKRDCFREISATFAEAECLAPGQLSYIWSCGGGGGGAATTGTETTGSGGSAGGRRLADGGESGSGSQSESGSGSGSTQGSGSGALSAISGELGLGGAQGSGAVAAAGEAG